jgi:two-component system, OmpR family, response regulator
MPTITRIIVVEDDPDLRIDLVDYLTLKGYMAMGAASAQHLWNLLAMHAPDLVLLDIGLPDQSGLDVAPVLRQRFPAAGIVMLTAFGDEGMRVAGLDGGADAYLVKGASLEVIEATCRSVLRRLALQTPAAPSPPMPEPMGTSIRASLKANDWLLHVANCTLNGPGQTGVELTVMEVSFLQRLMRTPGLTVSRTELLSHMGKPETLNNLRNLDGCAARLRKKVEQDMGQALPLRSFYGQGYVFTGTCQIIQPA